MASTGTWSYRSKGYALASTTADMFGATSGWPGPRSLLGTIRIRVTSAAAADPVFAGLPRPTPPAATWPGQLRHLPGLTQHQASYTAHSGGAPVTAPGRAGIWDAQAAGTGTQTLIWLARPGNWTVVCMTAGGSRPVAVQISVGAAMPALPSIGAGLLARGALLLAGGLPSSWFPPVAPPGHHAEIPAGSIRTGRRKMSALVAKLTVAGRTQR